MVEQTQQWQTFQAFMKHHHQEMLEHLQISQVVKDHCNNQLDSLFDRLASMKVQIYGKNTIKVDRDKVDTNKAVGGKAKDEAKKYIDSIVQVCHSFSSL